jgi:hypothetical protein
LNLFDEYFGTIFVLPHAKSLALWKIIPKVISNYRLFWYWEKGDCGSVPSWFSIVIFGFFIRHVFMRHALLATQKAEDQEAIT